jgi:alcohol dehydrogenase (cytochrome c)
MQANRNGFFYVLDRITGEFLLGTPFVKRLNWASEIGADGRPVLTGNNEPTAAGVKTCPAVRGATNWYATAFHPGTKLFYVMATEDCNLYKTSGMIFQAFRDPVNLAEKYLRAIDPESGKIVWEIQQPGAPETNYSGVLTTAGGLLFYGETGGGFAAVDAGSGKTLWHFETGQGWKASPMTYMVSGRQYVAIAAGNAILSFALTEREFVR